MQSSAGESMTAVETEAELEAMLGATETEEERLHRLAVTPVCRGASIPLFGPQTQERAEREGQRVRHYRGCLWLGTL